MKLIKCYISSFGKLKDFEYVFTDGINCINEPNGFGKTTFTIFLKSMFYGLKSTSRIDINDNERVKYRPWGSTEQFGGYIIFEINGKQFKIERYFAKKSSDDTITLTEVSTGKTFTDSKETEDLGKRLFKIDEDGFLSTTFFSQKDFEIKNNTSLTNKFNSTFDDDTAVYDKAIKKLDAETKKLKTVGDKGLIAETKRRINFLKEEILKGKNFSEVLDKLKFDCKNYSKRIDELKAENKVLNEKLSISASMEANLVKKTQLDKLTKEREEINKTLSNVKSILNGNDLSLEKLSYLKEVINDYNNNSVSVKNCKDDIENYKKQIEQEQQPKAKKSKLLTIISIIVALAGVGALFLNTILGIVLISVGAMSTVVSLLLPKKQVKPQTSNEYLENKERKYSELSKLCEEEKEAISLFLSKYNVKYDNYEEAVDKLKTAINDFSVCSSKIKYIDEEILRLKGQLTTFKESEKVENLAELNAKLDINKKEYEDILKKLSDNDSSIKYYDDKVASLVDNESELLSLTDNLKLYTEKYDILVKTTEFLKSADENLRIKYRQPLTDSFNKYLSFITSKNFKADIDIELNISIQESNGTYKSDYYSEGYQNLFNICKRFALTDILFSTEKPFVILDDPFENLDKDNLNGALKLIKQLSNNYQILYLICHDSRSVE